MGLYKLSRTLKAFQKRLATYPPSMLGEAMRALDKLELKYDLLREPNFDEIGAVRKELLIAQFQEQDATDAEIDEMLKRVGLA